MALTVVNRPNPAGRIQDMINGFVQRKQQEELMNLERQKVDTDKTYKTGMLQHQTDTLSADKNKVGFEAWKTTVLEPLIKAGRVQEAMAAAEAYSKSGGGGEYASGIAMGRPTTDLDTANANSAAFMKTQTGLAASGSEDAQARNYATLTATGKQLDAPQFGNQVQRELRDPKLTPKGSEYGTSVRVDGDLLPGAKQTSVNQTQIQMNREDNAAIDRRAENQGLNIGTYMPLTDTFGRVVGAWNAKTGEFKPAPIEGARKGAVPTGERNDAATAEGMQTDVARLRELAGKHGEMIGPVAGRVMPAIGSVMNIGKEREEMNQIVKSLKNRILYLKSGKQINEAEYKRLSDTLPNLGTPVDKFVANLNRLETEMTQVVKRNAALVGGGQSSGKKRRVYDEATGSFRDVE